MGQPQDREWTVDLRARDPETGVPVFDEDYAAQATAQAYLDLATIQHREGGTFIVAPLRTQVPAPPHALVDGPVWANIGLVVKHAFAPPVKRAQANGQPQRTAISNPVFTPEPEAFPEETVAPGLDPEADLVWEDDEDLRDRDEAEVAQAFEGDEPDGVVPQAPDPMLDVDAEQSRLSPADLMPRVQ